MKRGRPAILAEGLRKSYGKTLALDGLDLHVEEGTILGLLGPNGAGKTTAVRILTTLPSPDAGRAEVAGLDVVQQPDELRSRIGLTGQYAAVDEYLTGRENLEMVGRLYHLPMKQARRRADELLERFGLVDAASRLVKTYSGGMRRRLHLSASLVFSPPVLFLDEPTTGLDPRSRLAMWDIIGELVSGGTTLLLTTQYLDEADRLADRGTSGELKARVVGERLEMTVAQGDGLDDAARVLERYTHGDGGVRVDAERGYQQQQAQAYNAAVIVDNAIYVDGHRTAEPVTLEETYEAVRNRHGVAWIGLYRPTEEEFSSVAGEFGLHGLAVEDATDAHQRPKLERYGETLFVVLKPARYLDEEERVEFGEIHLFVGEDFVVSVRHGEMPDLSEVRKQLEADPEHLRRGPEAILHTIMDRVVDDYRPVVDGLENDIEEIETEVFGGNPSVSRRIYELSREVIEFQRATEPLDGVLEDMMRDETIDVDPEVRRHLRDVRDHVLQVTERLAGFRELLQSILSVNLTLASLAQNEQVKKISAWAAILFAPTLIGTIYGMNFDYMPELGWLLGYPFALVLMAFTSLTLYLIFKRRGWM